MRAVAQRRVSGDDDRHARCPGGDGCRRHRLPGAWHRWTAPVPRRDQRGTIRPRHRSRGEVDRWSVALRHHRAVGSLPGRPRRALRRPRGPELCAVTADPRCGRRCAAVAIARIAPVHREDTGPWLCAPGRRRPSGDRPLTSAGRRVHRPWCGPGRTARHRVFVGGEQRSGPRHHPSRVARARRVVDRARCKRARRSENRCARADHSRGRRRAHPRCDVRVAGEVAGAAGNNRRAHRLSGRRSR